MRPADWTWNTPLSMGIVAVAILGLAPLFGWALASERWPIIGMLIVLALVPIVVRWPVVSTFGLYAFIVPFDAIAGQIGAGGTTLTKLVGMWAIAGLMVVGLMERRLGRPPLAALWWSLFILWGILSAAWAVSPEMVFQRLPMALSLFALYLVAVSFRPSRSELYRICLLIVVGGAMAAAAGYLFGVEDAERGRLVLGDRDTNPNSLGAALIIPFALALAGAVGSRGAVQRAMAVGLVGLIGVGIFISASRAALLALIVTILVFLYRVKLRWQILAPAVVLSALAGMMPDTFYRRIGIVLTGEDATGAGRTEIWKTGLKTLEEFGLFGAGLDNFLEAWDRTVAYGPLDWARAAHNVYLKVWVELGILGLVLLLAALGSHLLAVHRARKAGGGGIALAALEAACLGVLVLTVFGDQIWRKFFWLAWILLTWATYCEVADQEHGKEPAPHGVAVGAIGSDRVISVRAGVASE